MLYSFFMVVHVIICLLLVVVVLMQSSKGGGLAGAFGGGGGLPQQMFGSRTMTTALHKMTIYLAVGFFLTSAILFILTADRSSRSSVIGEALDEGTLTSDVTVPPTDAPLTTEPEAVEGGLQSTAGGGNEEDDGQ